MIRDLIFNIISFLKGKSKLTTNRINENVCAIRWGYVNFFVYHKNETYICIDTGFNRKIIKREFNVPRIDPFVIKYVFLTHSDYDHIGGIEVFKNAEVYMSNKELEMIQKGKIRPFSYTTRSKQLSSIKTIKDERILYFEDIKIECILTPGHTDGSMSYLIDDKFLFAGDTCRIKNGHILPLQKYINMNTEDQINSIRKLKEYKTIEMTFVGHSGFKYGI